MRHPIEGQKKRFFANKKQTLELYQTRGKTGLEKSTQMLFETMFKAAELSGICNKKIGGSLVPNNLHLGHLVCFTEQIKRSAAIRGEVRLSFIAYLANTDSYH